MPSRPRAAGLTLVTFSLALTLAGCTHAHQAGVVATVNGRPILEKDVETLYQTNLGDSQQQPRSSRPTSSG